MPVLPGTLERPEHLPPTTTPHTYLADNADIASMLGALTPIMLIGLDIETTGPDPHRGRLRLLTLATPDRAYVIDCLKIPGVADLVAHLFRDPARTFVAHHAALAQGFLLAAGILPVDGVGPESGWWDTMIASQFLDGGPNLHTPSHHTLEGVATRLGMGARDAALLLPLYHKQRTLVEQAGLGQVAAIEMAAMPAMALMSFAGMPIDAGRWRALARDAQAAKVAAAGQIRALLGPIDPDSHAQVLKALRAAGVQIASTKAEALAAVAGAHAVIPSLLEYLKAGKMLSTYGTEFLAKNLNPLTGRIHTHLSQIGTTTGRMSSSSPNLQQVPRSADYRGAFRVGDGMALIRADYSQIEVRAAAVIAGEDTMLGSYQDEGDIYALTASRLLGIPEDRVTKAERQQAKAITLGYIFGMGAERCVEHAKTSYGVTLTLDDARAFRNAFFALYPQIKSWHVRETTCLDPDTDTLTADGGPKDTRTLAGRLRRDVTSYTERINGPVQGTAADGLKASLARLYRERGGLPGVRILLAIHDEILLEAPIGLADAAAAWLRRVMEEEMAAILGRQVPVVAEASVVRDWAGTPL